jgi:WD40 repeat protein
MKKLHLIILLLVFCVSLEAQNTVFYKALNGHLATVLSLAIDTNGQYLCSGSYDTDVFLWNAKSGELLQKYDGLSAGVWNVAFSLDKQYIACASWDNNTNAKGSSQNCIAVLKCPSLSLVKQLSISPDRYKSQGVIPELDDSTSNGVSKIAFSPDGNKLAAISNRGDLFVWDLTNNFEPTEYWFSESKHKLLNITPDLKYLVCTERKRTMADSCFYLLSFDDKIVASFNTPKEIVTDVFFSNSMKWLASVGGHRIKRNEIYLWNIETQQLERTLIGHSSVVRSIAFSSDEKLMASVAEDNLINLWNVTTGELLATFTEGNEKELTSVVFSGDDKFLICGSQDKTIKYWDISEL